MTYHGHPETTFVPGIRTAERWSGILRDVHPVPSTIECDTEADWEA